MTNKSCSVAQSRRFRTLEILRRIVPTYPCGQILIRILLIEFDSLFDYTEIPLNSVNTRLSFVTLIPSLPPRHRITRSVQDRKGTLDALSALRACGITSETWLAIWRRHGIKTPTTSSSDGPSTSSGNTSTSSIGRRSSPKPNRNSRSSSQKSSTHRTVACHSLAENSMKHQSHPRR